MAFEYPEDTREHVRYLKTLGVLKEWPDPDKATGHIWRPVEIIRLDEVRRRLVSGEEPANALDCVQERVDAILEQVKESHPKIALGEVRDSLLFAMGTTGQEIENLRSQCKYLRCLIPERQKRDAIFH
jgi:hypothetical protein